jgi:ferredoxin
MNRIAIPKKEWDERLLQLLSSFEIYAPVSYEFSCDYAKIEADIIPEIVYNKPKPVTPLKKFIIPVKANVTSGNNSHKPVLVVGATNCDVMGLAFLDEIYLDQDYPDPAYLERRDNTTIIATDCLNVQEHCHCNSYGIEPVAGAYSDLSLVVVGDQVIVSTDTEKGEKLLETMGVVVKIEPDQELLNELTRLREEVKHQLSSQNRNLPDYEKTGTLVSKTEDNKWNSFGTTCVSCGACSAICPTCSCFLLIDKPGFEKVRQLDTCQYPGFERVAGGEDALGPLPERFKNRYMCKYVWKPVKYQLKACTGCGRCIETCIGQINKNELFVELSTK